MSRSLLRRAVDAVLVLGEGAVDVAVELHDRVTGRDRRLEEARRRYADFTYE